MDVDEVMDGEARPHRVLHCPKSPLLGDEEDEMIALAIGLGLAVGVMMLGAVAGWIASAHH